MDTDRARLEQSCDELTAILRLLPPISLDPKSLSMYTPFYEPVISDTEIPHLGIQFHHQDIETGKISPPAIPCFLPRTDFPEVSEFFPQEDPYNGVFEFADEEAARLERYPDIEKLDIFPDDLMWTFDHYSFEGSVDLGEEFTDYSGRGRQLNRYGWVHDNETLRMVRGASDVRCEDRKLRALGMVDMAFQPGTLKRHSTSDDQSCVWATAELGTCGNNARPSRDEVAALVCAMLSSMWYERLSINDERPLKDNNIFPTMLIVFDVYGHSRVLTGYFDGQLHIQFTRIVDFEEYAVKPPCGTSYLDSIDKERFYDKINMLLKWSWPIPVGITDQDIPVILDLPTEVQPNSEVRGDEWLFV